MRNPLRRRWMLEKYDRRTGLAATTEAPEPKNRRRYWTYSGALADDVRLNSRQFIAGTFWRFRIVRLP